MDCSKITTGFAMSECDNYAVAGTASRAVIWSFTDVDKGKSVVADNVVKELILKQGSTAYAVESLPNTFTGEASVNVGTYVNTHQHSATIRILRKNEKAKKFVNGLTNGLVMLMIENNNTSEDGETKYEIYGWDSGLKLSELTATTDMADDVAYLATLTSPEVSQEHSLPKSFFLDDLATTELAVEALLTGSK